MSNEDSQPYELQFALNKGETLTKDANGIFHVALPLEEGKTLFDYKHRAQTIIAFQGVRDRSVWPSPVEMVDFVNGTMTFREMPLPYRQTSSA